MTQAKRSGLGTRASGLELIHRMEPACRTCLPAGRGRDGGRSKLFKVAICDPFRQPVTICDRFKG